MTHDANEHGEQGGHDVHLPDPSIWPLVAGVAAMCLGLSLVWWVADSGSTIAAVALGASVAFALLAAAGWAYQDSHMLRAATSGGHGGGEREPRYNQVVTFELVEGAVETSRSGGLLAAIQDAAAALHDMPGFQDLRLTVSPAATGASQVLVETTWSGREGLSTYDESRQTMLDLIAAHADEVVPGSVQAFDMEVIRDTKDMAFRFGWGPAAAIFGALAIGGLMVGAGLSIFQEEGVASEGGGGTQTPANPFEIKAVPSLKFDKNSLAAKPNQQVTFTFRNTDNAVHNVHFMNQRGGQTLAEGAEGEFLNNGQTEDIKFTTPAAGSYYFQCDAHPDMNGTFEVSDSGPDASGGGGAEGAPAASGTAATGSPAPSGAK